LYFYIIGEGCYIQDRIPNGRLNIHNEGAKLEVVCNIGYIVDGPSYVYCNDDLEWNEEVKGCKGEKTCTYIYDVH